MSPQSAKYLNIVKERVHSLLDDGYFIRFEHESMPIYSCKLSHFSNGNSIFIFANFVIGHMTQKTNGKIVFQGKL